MFGRPDPDLVEWLSSPDNPPVRYLTARNLLERRPAPSRLRELRGDVLGWEPLQRIIEMQLDDGSFPYRQKTPTAQPTLWALCLMARCGLDTGDEPVRRVVDYLSNHHLCQGALSYTTGASGVLPCYVGIVTAALIKMGALDTELVQSSIGWLIDHQRFDHREHRAGGDEIWPLRAPANFGCWETVSCYHGVAGAFRALAAVPPERRSDEARLRLSEAIEYLRIHDLYKKSTTSQPLFRHMTQFFLAGDYRSDLLDMLQGVADADPALIGQSWVRDAVEDVGALTDEGRVPLVKNYAKKLADPIPFEPIGEPSRFLTYQWLHIRRTFDTASDRQI